MKWVIYAIALAIGILCIVVPLVQSWDPEMMKTAVGFGIGVILATLYAAIRDIPTTARLPVNVGGAPGVTVSFESAEWYDWIVLAVLVFGGFLVGWAV